MQTTYRLKAKELSIEFLNSLKAAFTGQEVEITVKSVSPNDTTPERDVAKLLQMFEERGKNAPIISPDIDINALINESQCPDV